MLEDGAYEAFVLDVATEGDTLRLDLTIVAGAHKGEVVSVRALGLEFDELGAIGMPATVVVAGGQPQVRIETP